MKFLACPVSYNLVCHSRTPCLQVGKIDVQVESAATGILALAFVLQGDLAALRIPEEKPCRRVDELWQHTCFEAFLMTGDGPGYREYNFSPSGEWASYAFHDYRQAGTETDESAPAIRVTRKNA